MRTTIAERIDLSGRGIHTGVESRVSVLPRDRACGIVFASSGGDVPMRDVELSDAKRCTAVRLPDGSEISTVEHLLSALVGCGIDDAAIECEGGEVPILDGSAKAFADAIVRAGARQLPGERTVRSISAPIRVDAGSSFAAAFPSQETRFTYVVDYTGTAIGSDVLDVVLTSESYMQQIAPARTFALLSEVEALRAAGLALGGSLENALVVGPDGPMDGGPLRVAHEYAAHKTADMIGDLALLGALPRAHYVCFRGGHALHRRLAARMMGMIRS